MPPKKGRRQLKATAPSPKKLVLRGKVQAFADDAELRKDGSLDGSTSASSPSSELLKGTRKMRESLAPSPSPSLAASSAEPSSPPKRRILSGTLPPSPKKSKSRSNEGSITEHLTDLNIQSESSVSSVSLDETSNSQDETPKPKDKTTFNIDGPICSTQDQDHCEKILHLPLGEDAVSSMQHSENIELANTPRSKNSMDIVENTSDLSDFDGVPDDLAKVAQDLITSETEKHIAKIFKDQFAPKQAQIDQMREDVRQIGQLYNAIVASTEAENAANAQFQELLKHDLKIQEQNILRNRAKNSQIQERMELLEMTPKLSQAEAVDQEWELAMLQRRMRHYICVGNDGNDEFVKAPYSEQCYVDLARHILYLSRPENVEFHESHDSDSTSKVELKSDFNLEFLSLVSENGPCLRDLEAFEAVAWFISRHLLTEREETFRCLAAHPYYQQARQTQPKIKQELVLFFDRRFTNQMGRFYGLDIPMEGPLLRLGCDGAFHQEDSLDCGVLDDMAIIEDNVETWVSLITPIICKDEGTPGMAIDTKEQFHSRLLRVLPPLFSEEADDSKSAGLESHQGQYNDTLEQALTPKMTVKLASLVTQSEILEYKMLEGKTSGDKALEAQVAQRTDPEGPRTPDYEADTSDTEDEASGKNGSSVDSEMMDIGKMEAAAPPFLHAGYFQDHMSFE